jgi:hypothetical protein
MGVDEAEENAICGSVHFQVESGKDKSPDKGGKKQDFFDCKNRKFVL